MKSFFDLITKNKEWLFSGVGVAFALLVYNLLFRKKDVTIGQKSNHLAANARNVGNIVSVNGNTVIFGNNSIIDASTIQDDVISIQSNQNCALTTEQRRAEVREEIEALFSQNAAIYAEYGPHSDYSSALLTDAVKHWHRKVLDTIIPNNEKIEFILKSNRNILTDYERNILDKFLLHVDAFKYNHTSNDKNACAPLFPKEILDILKE